MSKISRRHVVITGAAVVAVTAFAASANTLAGLGQSVGWHGELSWSLPVAVDVLALVALVAWFTAGVQRLGQWMTAGSVVTSVVLNALGHLVSTGHMTVGPEMVIGVSAVPVISMALAAHLAVEVTKPEVTPVTADDHQDDREVTTSAAAPAAAPVAAPVAFDDHQDDHFPAAPVTTEVTAPAATPVTADDHQDDHQDDREVTTSPVMAAAQPRDEVTASVTAEGAAEVTPALRRRAQRLAARQDGKVTVQQLQDLGLSRRKATALRRELVAA